MLASGCELGEAFESSGVKAEFKVPMIELSISCKQGGTGLDCYSH
jgi:hypothetical protein